jgi:2-octaprenylphenol hydroxylase
MQQFDLIIVGGGLAGASLALALRHTQLRIALVESQVPRRPADWDARIYAISPANAGFLDSIGAWKHLDTNRLTPIRCMQIFGDAGGKLDFSAFDTGVSELGWILESSQMACEFWESAKRQSNLTLFCPIRPKMLSFTPDAAHLELVGGELLSAPLLVGADGRDSWVRNAAGLVRAQYALRRKGLVANFSTEKPHRHTPINGSVMMVFLPTCRCRGTVFPSSGPLPDENADELCQLPAEIFCERVAEAGAYQLGCA